MTLYLVQTHNDLCNEFSKMMRSEFEMSMMGELNFFLGLQIKQTSNGTMMHQQKYVKELLKQCGMESTKPVDTPISPSTRLVMDDGSPSVEEKSYRGRPGKTDPRSETRTEQPKSIPEPTLEMKTTDFDPNT